MIGIFTFTFTIFGNLSDGYPFSTKWLQRHHYADVFKTRVLYFKVKNTPLKTKNGKREFKRMLSFLFVEYRKLFIKKKRLLCLLFWVCSFIKLVENTIVTTASKVNLSLMLLTFITRITFCEDVRFRFWTLFDTQLMNFIRKKFDWSVIFSSRSKYGTFANE